jgi:PIN domain nuclease of toxin-antitoxin system
MRSGMLNNQPYILDTHVWVWLINGDKRLKPDLVKSITKAAQQNELYISAISVWEVCMLESKNRIVFSCPLSEWISRATSASGLTTVGLSNDISIESTRLPGLFHGDPADRIICASARSLNACLFTADTQIINYSKGNYLKVKKV